MATTTCNSSRRNCSCTWSRCAVGKPGVVGGGTDSLSAQFRDGLLPLRDWRINNKPGRSAVEAQQLRERFVFLQHGVPGYWGVETGDMAPVWRDRAQDTDDVIACLRIGGRREEDQREGRLKRSAQPAYSGRKSCPIATRSAPRRSRTMRYRCRPDDQKAARINRSGLMYNRSRAYDRAAGRAPGVRASGSLAGIMKAAATPFGAQCIDLVLHQRDQRRHDNPDPGPVAAPGSGKQSDLPPPVGISTSSVVATDRSSMTACCCVRKLEKPNTHAAGSGKEI